MSLIQHTLRPKFDLSSDPAQIMQIRVTTMHRTRERCDKRRCRRLFILLRANKGHGGCVRRVLAHSAKVENEVSDYDGSEPE